MRIFHPRRPVDRISTTRNGRDDARGPGNHTDELRGIIGDEQVTGNIQRIRQDDLQP
jgi:hypothetical protein